MTSRCEVCGQHPIRGATRTFFLWPTDPSQRTYWQTCLGVQDLNLNKPELFICSDHFDQMQMIRKGTALRKDAFPKRYDGPPPIFLEDEPPKIELPLETSDVKNEDVGIFGDAGPSAALFDDEEIMPEELSMAKLVQMFAAAAKERPSTIVPFVTPIAEETRAFSNILIDRQEKYLESYCKSCLRQAELVNMLEANCEGVPVTLMYKTVFMTEIVPSEVPQMMCHTCIGLLFQCFKFSTMTVRSCEVLQAARERFKYLPPLDDGTIDLKNLPDKYSAKPPPRLDSDIEDQKDDVKVVKSVKKRKSAVKSKEVPPVKKGRRTSTRRASEKAKKVSKKILEDSDEYDSNNDNFDNDEADPDFDAYEVKDESPEASDVEVEEKEEDRDDEDPDKDDQDPEDNYCMLCRHQFSNMARHMDKVHRVDWESKSCERKLRIKLRSPKKEKRVRKQEKPPRKVYKKSSTYTCTKCNISSKVFKEMFEHLQKDHKNDLDCIFCGDRFDHEIQLLDHLSEHGPRIYCRIHFIAFDNSEQWLEHVQEPTHPMQCGICDRVFKTRSGRDNHRNNTHLRPEQEIKCPQCPMVYGSRTNLRRHVRTFHEKRFYLCEDCGASFSTNHALKLHTAQKHNKGPIVGPIQCEYCGRIFADPRCLKAHKAKHFGQTEMCQYCGIFFESVEKLKEHVEAMKHHLYQCDLCSTTFKRKTFYLSHLLKTHNINMADATTQISMERKGIKMMKKKRVWKYAPKKGRKKSNPDDPRGRLLRGTDRPDVKVINGKKHYVCLVCDKMFLNDSNLARHKELHSDKKYKCHACSKVFAQKQGLQKHMPVHSDERPFECKICGKRYKDSCTLGKHKRIHGKSALIGINSVSLSPRRKKAPKMNPEYLNPSYYALPHVVSPQNYVASEESNEGPWFSRDVKCDYCVLVFENNQELFQHLLEDEKIKCDECHIKYDDQMGLKRHLKLARCGKFLNVPVERPRANKEAVSNFICTLCAYDTTDFKKMFEHVQAKHHAFSACVLCHEVFNIKYKLLSHYKMHGKELYCAEHCLAFDSHEESAIHHSTPGHDLQCGICMKMFESPQIKNRHRRISHYNIERPRQCPECPLTFTIYTSYKRHILSVHKKRVFLCEECGKDFKTNFDLKKHLAEKHEKGDMHQYERSHQCETCGQQLRDKLKFMKHKAAHLGHTKFCGYCQQSFKDMEGLEQHKKDSGHSWLECHKCSKNFKTQTLLSAHLLKCKTREIKPKKVMRPRGSVACRLPNGNYSCKICMREFRRATNVFRHYSSQHSDKTFPCEVCGKKFAGIAGVKAHSAVHNDEKPYQCQICAASFKDPSNFCKHKKTHATEKDSDGKRAPGQSSDLARSSIDVKTKINQTQLDETSSSCDSEDSSEEYE